MMSDPVAACETSIYIQLGNVKAPTVTACVTIVDTISVICTNDQMRMIFCTFQLTERSF